MIMITMVTSVTMDLIIREVIDMSKTFGQQYCYGSSNYSYNEIERSNPKKKMNKVKIGPESIELRLEKVFQQVTNDLYEMIDKGHINISEVEESIITNLLGCFNKTETAKITGLCIKTIRNKTNGYNSLQ